MNQKQPEMLSAVREFERRLSGVVPYSKQQADQLLSDRRKQSEKWRGRSNKKLSLMADSWAYNDLREPFIGVDIAAVTLAATAKALYPVSNFPNLGGQYFARIGKKLRIRLFGRMTTGATPGNGSFNILYGTGADANGVALMTGTPVALVANGTNLTWEMECFISCRSIGNVGTLFCTGSAKFHVGLLLSTNAPMLLPASAPTVSAACDLTAALIPSVQFLRSGSTAETMQVHDMEVTAMN
jgi:hypothetical protein